MVGSCPPGLTGKCAQRSPGAVHRQATCCWVISHPPRGVRMLCPIFRCGNWGARRRSLACPGDPAKGRRRRGPTPGQPGARVLSAAGSPMAGWAASCQNPGRGVGLKQPPSDPRESNSGGFGEEAHAHPARSGAPDPPRPAPPETLPSSHQPRAPSRCVLAGTSRRGTNPITDARPRPPSARTPARPPQGAVSGAQGAERGTARAT